MTGVMWGVIGGIVGSIVGMILILFLEKKGIIDKISRKMIWPPYYFDHNILGKAIEDAESEFYLITGDGSFIDEKWAIESIKRLIEKSRNTKIFILFTGDIHLPDIREKIYTLWDKSKYLKIYILEDTFLSQALRATFSMNTKQYCCLRIAKDAKKNEYILKKYEEQDLIKLITGYFDLTNKVVRVVKTDNQINIFIKTKRGQEKKV